MYHEFEINTFKPRQRNLLNFCITFNCKTVHYTHELHSLAITCTLNRFCKWKQRRATCILTSNGSDKYSSFHSSLPFEHLGQSNLFTRVCRLFVNQVTFYSILELKQCPRCQVFLKSIQHLSLGNDVTSSDKNIVMLG